MKESSRDFEQQKFIRHLEEEVQAKEQKYQQVVEELQALKLKGYEGPKEIVIQNENDQQLNLMQRVMTLIQEEASEQKRVSNTLLKEILQKMEEKEEEPSSEKPYSEENQMLYEEVIRLKTEVEELKESKKEEPMVSDYAEYIDKINELQKVRGF